MRSRQWHALKSRTKQTFCSFCSLTWSVDDAKLVYNKCIESSLFNDSEGFIHLEYWIQFIKIGHFIYLHRTAKTPLFIYGRCFFQRLLPKIIKYIASSYTYAWLHWSWNLSQPFCSSHYVTAYSNVYWISNSRPQWLFVVEFKIDQR